MVLVYTLAWVPMVFIAIANGVARDRGYKRYVTELRAHQISTLTGAVLFTIYTWALSLRWPPTSAAQAIAIGVIWFLLTVAFELLFGHFVAKFTWRRLWMDYNLLRGRVWVLMLVWLLVLPYVVYRFAS
ncbi:MAG TPA: hypothetical protein VLT83_03480 [Opitutaceae bacterium]|nr:hypothetical protein [Opitutaceae bacterium]